MLAKDFVKIKKKQKKFAKAITRSGDVVASMVEGYGFRGVPEIPKLEEDGKRIACRPMVIKEILSIWANAGVNMPMIAKTIKDIMVSRKSKKADKIKAAQFAYEVLTDRKSKENENGKGPIVNNVLQVFIDQRKDRGLSIPVEVEEAAKENISG